MNRYCLTLPLLFSALIMPAAFAQAGDSDIIVTAERRAQDRQNVPASIDVIGLTQIQKSAAVHPAELLNASSGVNIHRGSGQEHLTAIRSPVLTGGSGAGSFLYLEDGVPLRAAGFGNVNGLFEAPTELAGSIEVFKGPGSVLYGSNAVHGLINVISKAPQSDSGGNFRIMGSTSGLASASGSLTDGDMRLSASLVHDDGFRDDSGFDQQKLTFRKDASIGEWEAIWTISAQNLNQETAGFAQGDDAYKDEALSEGNAFDEAYRDARSLRSQLRLEKALSGDRSLVFTPYARTARIEFLRHFLPGQSREDNGHNSIGLLSSLYGDNWVAGVDAEFTKGYLDIFQDNPARFRYPQGAHYDFEVQSSVIAAYGQNRWALSDALTFEAGLRAELTQYEYDNQIDSGVFGRIKRVDDRSDDFFTVTPTASLTYARSPHLTYYARAARGARAPQVTDLYAVQINQEPGDADVETLDSFEAGIKAKRGETRWSLAAYTMQKENFFFRKPDGFNQTDGKTDHMGVEGEISTPINDWLSLRASGTYAVHTYAFTDAVSRIKSGDDVDSAPRTLGTLALRATPIEALAIEAEWRHVGDYFTNPANTQKYDGHDIFVLRSDYDVSTGIKLFGRVDNVFDTQYADRADFAFGSERYFPGRPRTLFMGLSSNF